MFNIFLFILNLFSFIEILWCAITATHTSSVPFKCIDNQHIIFHVAADAL